MGLLCGGRLSVNPSLKAGAGRSRTSGVAISVSADVAPRRQEVAVVRHLIADGRNVVVGAPGRAAPRRAAPRRVAPRRLTLTPRGATLRRARAPWLTASARS